jgi:hypothetical protein
MEQSGGKTTFSGKELYCKEGGTGWDGRTKKEGSTLSNKDEKEKHCLMNCYYFFLSHLQGPFLLQERNDFVKKRSN